MEGSTVSQMAAKMASLRASSQSSPTPTVALVINCIPNDGGSSTQVQQRTNWYEQLNSAVQDANASPSVTILTITEWKNHNSHPERNVIAFDNSRRLAFIAIESHQIREHVLRKLSSSAANGMSFNVVFLTRLYDQPAWHNLLARSAAIIQAYAWGGYDRSKVCSAVYDLPRTNARDVDRLCLWEPKDDSPPSHARLSTDVLRSANPGVVTTGSPAHHQATRVKMERAHTSSVSSSTQQSQIKAEQPSDSTVAAAAARDRQVKMEKVYSPAAPLAATQQEPGSGSSATNVSLSNHQQSRANMEQSYNSPVLQRAVQLAALRAQIVVLTEYKGQLEMRESELRYDISNLGGIGKEIASLNAQILHHTGQIEELEREG